MKTRRGWPILATTLLITLTSSTLNGCKPHQVAATPKAVAVNAETDPAVVTQAVRVGNVSQTVTVSGSLVALEDISLSAKQGGRLAAVNVREGDTVSAGQILARVDATDLQSQVSEDEAGVDSALAKLEQARAAYHQQVTDTKVGIDSAHAAYEQQVATSSAQVRSAQSALTSARANLSTVQEGARPEERLQTEASLTSAQANYKKAQADVNRYEKLHNAGAVSDAEMDQYRNTRDVALANLNSAQAALKLQQEGNRRQDIDQAQEKVRQAEESLRQAVAARSTDAVKKADLDTAIASKAQNRVKLADVQAAQAALEQAQKTLAIARQAVADALVIAPISGRISVRSAEPGQVVKSDTVLLHLITLNSVYFEPSVPDIALGAIKTGQPVDVQIDTYPGHLFQGTITRIYPQASSTNRSVPLRVTVPNTRGLLRPNMFAQGKITTEVHRNAVLAPQAALVQTNGASSHSESEPTTSVFTVENGVARQHTVTTGLSADKGDWVEVKGLSARATVIVLGQNGLKDGEKVAVPNQTQTASR
jgi:HlyD family secretion protein